MTYAGKIVCFIGVTIGKSAFKRTEIAKICTIIGINSDKATRQVIDITGKLVFENIGKYRKITVTNCATYSFSVSLNYDGPA